jgi:ribosomal protein L9
MVTEVSILLFLKPSDEMEIEGGKATPKMLREKAQELKERLERAAEILEKLKANGWELSEAYGSIYTLDFYKDISEKEARRELKRIGIDPKEVSIRELEEEE